MERSPTQTSLDSSTRALHGGQPGRVPDPDHTLHRRIDDSLRPRREHCGRARSERPLSLVAGCLSDEDGGEGVERGTTDMRGIGYVTYRYFHPALSESETGLHIRHEGAHFALTGE